MMCLDVIALVDMSNMFLMKEDDASIEAIMGLMFQ
jgi:hypothetical protein